MSTRSATETVVGIFLAFLEEPTWKQSELADRLGIETRALRRRLEELEATGRMPLHRDEDLPHVYWSVPSDWVPGGVLLDGAQAGEILRLLARLPQSADRDRYLNRLVGHVGEEPAANVTPLRSNEQHLRTIEEAASRKVPVLFDHFSTNRGDHRQRVASVHLLQGGDHWRFVATCHDRNHLCWFRVDNVLSAALAPAHEFRAVDEAALQHFLCTSIDGFAGSIAPVQCWFVVRLPEARWVRLNLPDQEAFEVTAMNEAWQFRCTTTALDVLARFVAGLGAATKDCSVELREKVVCIAEETLGSLATERQTSDAR